jgi:hypothetical protein
MFWVAFSDEKWLMSDREFFFGRWKLMQVMRCLVLRILIARWQTKKRKLEAMLRSQHRVSQWGVG